MLSYADVSDYDKELVKPIKEKVKTLNTNSLQSLARVIKSTVFNNQSHSQITGRAIQKDGKPIQAVLQYNCGRVFR